jgi:hypothetical protein
MTSKFLAMVGFHRVCRTLFSKEILIKDRLAAGEFARGMPIAI